MSVNFPMPGIVDIREPIVGDSFNWAGTEPTAAKKSLVFHHSGSANAPGEDGFSIAEYHVNGPNQWGGIGYHFVITRSDYPGREGKTPAGAQIQYVGDLSTWRAHVYDQNPGRVGICLVGMDPDEGQLKLARELVDYLLAPNFILPSINYYSQVTVHRLVPEQSTDCPGDAYTTWLPYLQGGPWPYTPPMVQPVVTTPAPTPAPEPAPEPVPVPVVPPPTPVVPLPAWEATYAPNPIQRTIQRPGATAIDAVTNTKVADIPVGTVVDIAGYFTNNNTIFARSVWSAQNNKWNGIDEVFFTDPDGQNAGTIPTTVVPSPTPAPSDTVATDVTDEELQAATVPESLNVTLGQRIADLFAQFVAWLLNRKKGK